MYYSKYYDFKHVGLSKQTIVVMENLVIFTYLYVLSKYYLMSLCFNFRQKNYFRKIIIIRKINNKSIPVIKLKKKMSRRMYKYHGWKPSGSNDYTATYLRRAEMILNKEKTTVEAKPAEAKLEPVRIVPVVVEEKKPNWRPPGSGSAKIYDFKRVEIVPISASKEATKSASSSTKEGVKTSTTDLSKKSVATQSTTTSHEAKPSSDLILFRDSNNQLFMVVDNNNNKLTTTTMTTSSSTNTSSRPSSSSSSSSHVKQSNSSSTHHNHNHQAYTSSSMYLTSPPPPLPQQQPPRTPTTNRIVIETTIEHSPSPQPKTIVTNRPVTAFRLVPTDEQHNVVYVPENGSTSTLHYYKPVRIESKFN